MRISTCRSGSLICRTAPVVLARNPRNGPGDIAATVSSMTETLLEQRLTIVEVQLAGHRFEIAVPRASAKRHERHEHRKAQDVGPFHDSILRSFRTLYSPDGHAPIRVRPHARQQPPEPHDCHQAHMLARQDCRKPTEDSFECRPTARPQQGPWNIAGVNG